MPAGTTALNVVTLDNPRGGAIAEQSSDVTNGNSFLNLPNTDLYVRNILAVPLWLDFYVDLWGAEVTIMSVSITDRVGGDHGVHIFRNLPAVWFNDHSTTDAAKSGHVMMKQRTGNDGELLFCPIRRGF